MAPSLIVTPFSIVQFIDIHTCFPCDLPYRGAQMCLCYTQFIGIEGHIPFLAVILHDQLCEVVRNLFAFALYGFYRPDVFVQFPQSVNQCEKYVFDYLFTYFPVKGKVRFSKQGQMILYDGGDFRFQRDDRRGLYCIEDIERRLDHVCFRDKLRGISQEKDLQIAFYLVYLKDTAGDDCHEIVLFYLILGHIDRSLDLSPHAKHEDTGLQPAGEIGVHIQYFPADIHPYDPVFGYVQFG